MNALPGPVPTEWAEAGSYQYAYSWLRDRVAKWQEAEAIAGETATPKPQREFGEELIVALHQSHPVTITSEQVEALEHVPVGEDVQAMLPFDPIYFSIVFPPGEIPGDDVRTVGLLATTGPIPESRPGEHTSTVFPFYETRQGNEQVRRAMGIPHGPACAGGLSICADRGGLGGVGRTYLWLPDSSQPERSLMPTDDEDEFREFMRRLKGPYGDDAEAMVHRIIADRLVLHDILYFLQSVNVEIAPPAVSRQVRRSAERKGMEIAPEVTVRRSRKRTAPESRGGHTDYSHQFEVSGGYVHHFETKADGTENIQFQRMKRAHPDRMITVKGRPCFRFWRGDYVKGPADKPLVRKVRRLTRPAGEDDKQ